MNTNNNTTVFTFRINTTLYQEIKGIAQKERRSTAKQMEFMLEQNLKENKC